MEYEEAYSTYYTPVYRFVANKVLHHEEAEDITQETFTRAYVSWSKIEEKRLYSWLFTVASHLVLDRWRRINRRPIVNIDLITLYADDQTSAIEYREEITRLLSHLPEKRRATFYLLDRGYTFMEIATLFNMNYNAVKTNSSRDTRKMAAIRQSSV